MEKMKKFIACSFLMVYILISGCLSDSEKDTVQGEIREITMDKLQSKMSSEETFVLVVTRDNCRYCDEFYDLMETYLLNHPVEIWDLSIDGETEEEKEEVETEIRELFPSFAGTPNIFYIKEGKLKSQLNNMDYDLTEELFDKWVNKYELDKKGKL